MKPIAMFTLLVLVTLAGAMPAQARSTNSDDTSRQSPAAREQQKMLKKAAKKQRKAMKRAVKAQRKAQKPNHSRS